MFLLNDSIPVKLSAYFYPTFPPNETWGSLALNSNYLLAFKYFVLNGGLFLTACLWGLAFIGILSRYYAAPLNSNAETKKISFATLVFLSCATGFALIIAILFVLSVFHFLDETHVCIIYGITSISALSSVVACRKEILSRCKFWSSFTVLLASLVFVFLLLVYQFSISNAPIIADATSFHVPYADYFLKHHGLAIYEHMIYPYHVFNINLLFSLALMLDHELSYVQSISGLFAAMSMLGIYAFCRESGQQLFIAILLPFIFCMDYTVSGLAISGNVDLGGMFFVFSCVFAFYLWQKTCSPIFLILSAISLGIAIGSKYILLIFPVPVALCLFYFDRPHIWRNFLLYTIWTACWGLWWYIRNIIYTGNPIHPFAQGIFGYYLWTPQDMVQQMAPILNNRIPRSLTGVLLAPWYAYHSEVLMYQGSFPIVVMLFVSSIFAKWINKGMNMLICFAWIYLVSWIWGSQDPRHLLPLFPIVLIYCGMVVSRIYNFIIDSIIPLPSRNSIINAISAAAVIAVLIYGSLYVRKQFVFIYYNNLAPGKAQDAMQNHNALLELAYHVNEVFSETDTIYEIGMRELHSFVKANMVGNPFGPHGYWRIMDAAAYPARGSVSPVKLEVLLKERYGAQGIVLPNAPKLPYSQEEFDQYLDLRYRNSEGSIYRWKVAN